MGLLSKWFGTKTEEVKDPLTEALRSLGSKDENIRQNASKMLFDMGPAVIQYLLAIVENKQAENERNETAENLKLYTSNAQCGVIELVTDLNCSNTTRVQTANKKLRSLPSDKRKMIESFAKLDNAWKTEISQRESAIGILTQLEIPSSFSPQVLQVLVSVLAETSGKISESSAKLLMNYGDAAVPYLINALVSTDKNLKTKSISILENTRLTNSDAVPDLINLLADESKSIRLKAIKILGNMKGLAKDAIIPLLSVRENYSEVQTALVNIGPSDYDAIVQGLTNINDDIKISAADVLHSIGSDAKIALLDLYRLLKSNNEKVRESAAKAILNIHPDSTGIPVLIESLADTYWNVQECAVKSLVLCGKTAIPYLIKELSSTSPVVKANAAETLGLMKSEAMEALPELERMLDDEDAKVKHAAISAIGNIGCVPAHLSSKLLDMWKQGGENILLEALSKIKEPKVIEILLRSAFSSPSDIEPELQFKSDHTPAYIKKCLTFFSDVSNLNDGIIGWAVDASTYQHKYRSGRYDAGYISLDLSDEAIQNLCNVKTPVTDNILCMVAEKKDIGITMDKGCGDPWEETVSFQYQREIALKELAARGNPIFDPSLFIKHNNIF